MSMASLVALAAPAAAHAILESSTPPDGAVLRDAPTTVRLHFSEAVTITLGSLRVVDGRGARVDLGDVSHGGSNHDVVVSLHGNLAVGTYVVGWHVISADTHPVHGGFLFSVGSKTAVASGVAASLATTPGATTWQTVGRVLRWVTYAGAFLAAGLAIFTTWIDDDDARFDATPRPSMLVGVFAIAATVTIVLGLGADAAAATGLGVGSVFRAGVLRQVLGGGTNWTVVAVAASGLLAWLAVRGSTAGGAARRMAAIASGLVAGAGFTASGHSRSTTPETLVVLVDAVHVAAGAVWVGGLLGLILAIRRHRARATSSDASADAATAAANVVARFSRVATWALLAVVAAGLTLAWAEVRAVRAITSTTYGWLLVAKVSAVGAVLLVAAYNHVRLTPAVQARPTSAQRWSLLRRTVGTELAVLLGVLALTSVLVDTVPARTAAGIGTVASRTARFGTGSVQVVVDPARRGNNAVHMYILDANGSPLDRLSNVRIDFALPAADLGPIDRKAFHAGPGHWQINGDAMSVTGTWKLTVYAQPDAFHELSTTVSIPIQP